MVKIVQWDFSLIMNQPHTGWAFVPTGIYNFTPGHANQLASSGKLFERDDWCAG
jgi:hypothetical protein